MKFDHLVNQLLSESLDNPYDAKWSVEDMGYVFHPNPNNTDEKYVVWLPEDKPGELSIFFIYSDRSKGIESTTEMTGTGNAHRVIATVVNVVRKHLNSYGQNKYKTIKFTAKSEDQSRVALYKRLARMLAKNMGSNWDLDIFKNREDTIFVLSRRH